MREKGWKKKSEIESKWGILGSSKRRGEERVVYFCRVVKFEIQKEHNGQEEEMRYRDSRSRKRDNKCHWGLGVITEVPLKRFMKRRDCLWDWKEGSGLLSAS